MVKPSFMFVIPGSNGSMRILKRDECLEIVLGHSSEKVSCGKCHALIDIDLAHARIDDNGQVVAMRCDDCYKLAKPYLIQACIEGRVVTLGWYIGQKLVWHDSTVAMQWADELEYAEANAD